MSGVLLKEMEENTFERGRLVAAPARTGLAQFVELVALHDFGGMDTAHAQLFKERFAGIVEADAPAIADVITPGIGDRTALETPTPAIASRRTSDV